MDTRYLSSETTGGFTGTAIGLYATSATDEPGGYETFRWFDYEEK